MWEVTLTSLSVSVFRVGVLISVPNRLGLITRPLRLVFSTDSSLVGSSSTFAFLADLLSSALASFASTSATFRFSARGVDLASALGSALGAVLEGLAASAFGVSVLAAVLEVSAFAVDFAVSALGVGFTVSALAAIFVDLAVSALGVSVFPAGFWKNRLNLILFAYNKYSKNFGLPRGSD